VLENTLRRSHDSLVPVVHPAQTNRLDSAPERTLLFLCNIFRLRCPQLAAHTNNHDQEPTMRSSVVLPGLSACETGGPACRLDYTSVALMKPGYGLVATP
jgi:hypothetical protein